MIKKGRQAPRHPLPTVDIIIEVVTRNGRSGIVLIERKNPPYGWALPGGFVEYGEALEQAAVREAREETSLEVKIEYQLHTYSDPRRDPRGHTISTVFVASARGEPKGRDDARRAAVFTSAESIPPLAFDHRLILDDYFQLKKSGRKRPRVVGDKNPGKGLK